MQLFQNKYSKQTFFSFAQPKLTKKTNISPFVWDYNRLFVSLPSNAGVCLGGGASVTFVGK